MVVSDIERSLVFYRDLLGLEVVRRMDETGPHLDAMLGLRAVEVTTVKLGAAAGPTLVELLHFRSPEPTTGAQGSLTAVGPTHLALTVRDVGGMARRLAAAGVPLRSEPHDSPDGYARVVFCSDPDGTPIELVEVRGVA